MRLKQITFTCILLCLIHGVGMSSPINNDDSLAVNKATYLKEIKTELKKHWPNNRTINIVFHGHSVPTGYFTKGVVHKYEAYPHLVGKMIKKEYPYAVINIITTSIGGENAVGGAPRFKKDVLTHHPDVVFIDYALNDRGPGVKKVKPYWEQMIKKAKAAGVKVILMTPTPDLREDIESDSAPLAKHAEQIRALAKKYRVGLVDSYHIFKEIAKREPLKPYMAQNNHINAKGHKVVAKEIIKWFE